MINWVVLIILGISQVIFCNSISNLTNYDLYSVYPILLSRIKRSHGNPEYTRWRANEGTTDEFIVKVLEDEIIDPNPKKIVAVNIEPITNSGENIIVGGVIVPQRSHTWSPSTESFKDYTRFMPPTIGTVTNVGGGDLYFQSSSLLKTRDKLSPILPRVGHVKSQNSQRDDSPPANPQFIARTPQIIARQYAPIAPVVFTQRATYTPLKPSIADSHMLYNTFAIPSRTPLLDMIIPLRTRSNSRHLEDVVTPMDAYLIPTTSVELNQPEETSIDELRVSSSIELAVPPIQKVLVESDTNKNKQKKDEKILDTDYKIPFYRDEDNDEIEKKDNQLIIGDLYLDKSGTDLTKVSQNELNINETGFINATNPDYFTNYGENELDGYENISEKTTLLDDRSVSYQVNTSTQKLKEKRNRTCNMLKLRQLHFNSPLSLPEVVTQLKKWSEESPLAKWIDITDGNFTTMENPIYMMIVDDPTSGQILSAKQTVMIVAGIQGRDHHAVAAAMYVLYQLIEHSEDHTDLLTKYRFWIIPVFNPDGYDYSMKFPHRHEWKKNLRQTWDLCKDRESCYACKVYGLRCAVQPCYGVNLDRNFEYQWIPAEELRTEHPCGGLYAGTRQLSEPETRALTNYLHEQRTSLFAFIAFKEGDVLGIMYPYSHTRKKRAFDHIYRQRASRAASAAFSISGRPYMAGQTSEFLPLYAGGIEDWVDGHLGIDNTYTIMMFRPTDAYNSKLIAERIVYEAYAAIDTLLLQSVEPLAPQITVMTKSNHVVVVIPNRLIMLLPILIYNILFY